MWGGASSPHTPQGQERSAARGTGPIRCGGYTARVNAEHLRLCASAEWAEYVSAELLPWASRGLDLGDEVLEVGAGPGLVTDLLRAMVPRLVAVELDPALATALRRRLDGGNVEVVNADATALPFESGRFSSIACFTMLHHVPSLEMQDRMLAELSRVLRPGGFLFGTDALDTPERRELHVDDVFVPALPDELPARLRAAGFASADVEARDDRFRFLAITPR
jgi:ubiquinone/menaquinone biosynthesis C-methylase UbiE